MGRISAFRSCAVGRVTFFYEIIFVRKALNYSELLWCVKNSLKIVVVLCPCKYLHGIFVLRFYLPAMGITHNGTKKYGRV